MAALVLAVTPGPGIFYVLARSLAGGRREGIESSLGTFVGGLFHVIAAALGISAILAASAVAFHTVKYAGAAYLVFLGVKMFRTRNAELSVAVSPSSKNAFRICWIVPGTAHVKSSSFAMAARMARCGRLSTSHRRCRRFAC